MKTFRLKFRDKHTGTKVTVIKAFEPYHYRLDGEDHIADEEEMAQEYCESRAAALYEMEEL